MKGDIFMRKEREAQLQNRMDDLIQQKKNLQIFKDAEWIICAIQDIMKVLNQDFPDEDIQGFVFEREKNTQKIHLKTYPSEVFPSCFALSEKEENKQLARQIEQAKCESSVLSDVCRFFTDGKHTSMDLMEKIKDEVYKIKFK